MPFRAAHLSVGQAGVGDDRCAVLVYPHRLVIVVADGAGGSGRGAEAATAVVQLVSERSRDEALDAVELLRDCDLALARRGRGGETTAVVAIVDEAGISGASVGDSGAWIVESGTHTDLTCDQARKPLIGSGEAIPTAFASGPMTGTLLIASDGLFSYGNVARIRQIVANNDFEAIAEQLVASVRLRSGALQDDTTVAICRRV